MKTFDNIVLTGRPASGKSELINFLKGVPVDERIKTYHIGEFEELDDFLWVWELGESDDIWEQLGVKRTHLENVGYGYVAFDPVLVYTKFMNIKMNRKLVGTYLADSGYYDGKTLFVEFARGGEKTYEETLNSFDKKVLEKTAIFFLNNSFEECVRRNNARYEAEKKHSILAHKTPDKELFGHYKDHDWLELTDNKQDGYLTVKGVKVPFVTVANEPELTDSKLIEERFSPPLKKLWTLYSNRR